MLATRRVRFPPGTTRLAFWAFWSLTIAFLLADVYQLVAPVDPAIENFFTTWGENGLCLAGAGACLARATQGRGERLAWGLLGAGLVAWPGTRRRRRGRARSHPRS